MNNPQTTGVLERQLYSFVLGFCVFLAQKGWITGDFAPYLAGGIMAAVTSVYGWWINRPVPLLNDAQRSLPEGTRLVLRPSPVAQPEDQIKVAEIAKAANNKVSANVS